MGMAIAEHIHELKSAIREKANEQKNLFHRVAICVCTCNRPKMLEACLNSLATQFLPDEIRPLIIVIDNEAEPNNEAAVLEFEKTAPYEVAYWHEPKRGIPQARNAALKVAIDSGAEWVAFIDDDEIADPDWLANLMVEEYRHLPILGGHHSYQYPAKLPFWMVKPASRKAPNELALMRAVGAGNMRIRADVIHAGARFDERYALLGGEDTRFCTEARKVNIPRQSRGL